MIPGVPLPSGTEPTGELPTQTTPQVAGEGTSYRPPTVPLTGPHLPTRYVTCGRMTVSSGVRPKILERHPSETNIPFNLLDLSVISWCGKWCRDLWEGLYGSRRAGYPGRSKAQEEYEKLLTVGNKTERGRGGPVGDWCHSNPNLP